MFIDTHCHLNMMVKKKFDQKLEFDHLLLIDKIVTDAHAAGVQKIINVGTSLLETENSITIAQRYDQVVASAGIHPCDVRDRGWRDDFTQLKKLVAAHREHKIVAIGETGLDYYHKPFDAALQKEAFRAHIELAVEHDLPLVVHVREAADDALEVLSDYSRYARGVNHCFMQEAYVAKQLTSWGWYVGIDGPITYPKNESFRQVVAGIPLEHILLETDAPFLPPQQYRGKQNSPAYIPLFAQAVADLHHVSLAQVGRVTSQNAERLFAI